MIHDPEPNLQLNGYKDADFAGLWGIEDPEDPVCVKSRMLTLGSCPLLWVSKLQTEIALSMTEAEHIALSQSMQDFLPMKVLVQEVGRVFPIKGTTQVQSVSTVFEDNNGALGLATAPKLTPNTKFFAIKYHWFKEQIGEKKGIILEKVESEFQKADIFTKGMPAQSFERIRKLLMGW